MIDVLIVHKVLVYMLKFGIKYYVTTKFYFLPKIKMKIMMRVWSTMFLHSFKQESTHIYLF